MGGGAADVIRANGTWNPEPGTAATSLSALRLAVSALERAPAKEVRLAVRDAVRAYARDPSEANATKVAIAIHALRRQRARTLRARPLARKE